MVTDSEEIAGIYREISKFPTLLKGCIGPQVTLKHRGKYCTIYTEWSQRDLERAERVKLCREYIVFYDENFVVHTGPLGKCTELRGDAVGIWNALPEKVMEANSINNFKRELDRYLKMRNLQGYGQKAGVWDLTRLLFLRASTGMMNRMAASYANAVCNLKHRLTEDCESALLLNTDSPSGTLKAVLRGHTNKKGEDQQYLEIWSKTSKEKSINLTALDKHDKVYEDDQFGRLAWSHSETCILYIAEKKRPKAESFFQNKPELGVNEEDDNGNKAEKCQKPVKGDQFVYWEDWGEALVNKSTPVLCVLDIESDNISILEGVPEHISPGQAIWAPKDTGIIFVGWWHMPWRLGLKYCTNRKSALYCVDLTGNECLQISSGINSVHSPRLSPDQRHVIYLEGGNVRTHHQCYSLSLYNFDKKVVSTVVKIVDYPTVDGFTGIYSSTLAQNCWATDSQRVVIDTAQRSRKDLIVVNSATGIVTSLTTGSEAGSWTLLDIHQDLMVVSCSSPNCPPNLKVGFLPATGQEQGITWLALDEAEPLPGIEWKILTFTPPFEQENPKFPDLQFEGILLIPGQKKGVKPPLVVSPHGGPNSVFVASWMLVPVALCRLGYTVLLVNYRGSSGFGQDSIRSLPGNIGSQDVKDVQYAVESVRKEGFVDSEKLLLIGGSHGGFIGCHLIGQYPGFYKAFATRNPVINLASKLGTTDIPDHTMVQAGFDFAPDQLPTPSVLTALLSKSPITYVSRARTPVLIMLGGKDKRVHPTQGLELYHALRARGVPVRLLWYPDDNHSLSKVGTEADVFMNVALWFAFALDLTTAV